MAKQTVKEKLLYLFMDRKNEYISGEELATTLSVTRAAIWKAISKLREEGYEIDGTTNKGYALKSDIDLLSTEAVFENLSAEAKDFYRVECTPLTSSTNSDVRERGIDGEKEGLCIAAEEQLKGRGRQGRSFYSPKNTGVYFSILLRPNLKAEEAVLITAAAAVACAEAALKAVPSLPDDAVKIKWVNDLYVNDLKVNGILTEAMLSLENGGLTQAVLGIGFNLYTPKGGWPEEIRGIAGSLLSENEAHIEGLRAKLVAEVLNAFLPLYKNLSKRTFIDEYRKRQYVFGKTIEVLSGEEVNRLAEAVDVDSDCHLLIHYLDEPENELHALNSGEVRVKPLK